MQDAIVLIESNTTTAELFIKAAREEKLEPVVIAIEPGRYAFLKKLNVDCFQTDTNNPKRIIKCIEEVGKKYNVKGIASSSEYYIEIAARTARHFNLYGADPDAVKNCRDKCEQRRILNASGVGIPLFFEITNLEQGKVLIVATKYPAVVKPAFGSGSIGVKMCYNAGEVLEQCAKLLEQKTNERGIPLTPKVLVEEYVEGSEYSVENFNGKFIGITKKYVSDPPYFIETGHDFPDESITESVTAEIEGSVTKALEALGLIWGPVHTELKIVDGKSIIIEINPRLAGGFIPVLIQLSNGIDLIRETVKLWAGKEVNLEGKTNKYASVRFLIPRKEGKFKMIENLEEVEKLNDVYEIKLYKEFGTELKMTGDF